jgi:hypothetical protein
VSIRGFEVVNRRSIHAFVPAARSKETACGVRRALALYTLPVEESEWRLQFGTKWQAWWEPVV